jgi:hypothetical protein
LLYRLKVRDIPHHGGGAVKTYILEFEA